MSVSTQPTTPSATALTEPPRAVGGWTRVCHLDRIVPDTGVAALVDGTQVAVFRLGDGRVHAIANHDPCSGANVLARGIVGDVDGEVFVASPIHKQRFDLRTGACLDADGIRVAVHATRTVDGYVEVARAAVDG
jgi:nitrite reductase (NADH) small subunit